VRKRIVIGLLILSAIGTAVFFVLQPKKGSVEWHKRKYLEAYDTGVLAALVVDRGMNAVDRMHWKFKRKRIEFHRQALIDAGFFEQKQFVFSNRPPREAIRQVLSNSVAAFTNTTDLLEFPVIREITTNSITVVAQGRVMREFKEPVRPSP